MVLAVGTHSNLIGELGVLLVVAAVITLFFQKLRLPVFLGYLMAGFVIGPGMLGWFPTGDDSTVKELSEFGLIFLMFYIGLEFDLRRLQRVLAPAGMAILFQTSAMLLLGLQLSPLIGGGWLQGVFLGALLSISSTMVTVSVLRDLGRMQKPHAQLAIGVLILEDILAIVLLVVLSGMSVSVAAGGDGVDLMVVVKTTLLIGFFVTGIFFVGRIAAPKLLNTLEAFGSAELVTISSMALMMGFGMLAQNFEFSSALGAFLAGSILSQSKLAVQIERQTQPLRDVFCAVFFVTIGMLIMPSDIFDNWLLILGLSLLLVVVKVVSVWLGLFLAGQMPDTSFRAAVTKAQIGEFSFVIVSLGMDAGVTDSRWMAVAVGASVVSAGIGLMLTIHADDYYDKMAARMPKSLCTLGNFYRNVIEQLRGQLDRNTLLKLVRRPLLQITFNVFLISSFVVFTSVGAHYIESHSATIPFARAWLFGLWVFCALLSLPFATAIIRNVNAVTMLLSDSLLKGFSPGADSYRRNRLASIFQNIATAVVMLLVSALYLSAMAPYLPKGGGLVIFLAIAVAVGYFFWNRIIRLNSRLEILFMESFNQIAPSAVEQRKVQMMNTLSEQYPWPAEISACEVVNGSEACGHSIRSLSLRERTGATIVAISRGGQALYDPSPETVFFPGDNVYLFGDKTQTAQALEVFEAKGVPVATCDDAYTFQVEKLFLTPKSEIVDQTLASADLRRKLGITVLGIQRGSRQITTLTPDEILMPGDLLYVIGNRDSIRRLQETGQQVTRPPIRPLSGQMSSSL